MAKGAKALAAEMKRRDEADRAERQATVATAKIPSAAETDLETDRVAKRKYRMGGDFSKPPEGLVGLGYGPATQARREAEQAAVPTGILGMGAGYADPTALALARQNMGDENAERDAQYYQDDLRAYLSDDSSQALMAQDFARKMGLLGNATQMSQFSSDMRRQTQPQSIMPMLLSGLIGAAGSFATGGLSSMVGKK